MPSVRERIDKIVAELKQRRPRNTRGRTWPNGNGCVAEGLNGHKDLRGCGTSRRMTRQDLKAELAGYKGHYIELEPLKRPLTGHEVVRCETPGPGNLLVVVVVQVNLSAKRN